MVTVNGIENDWTYGTVDCFGMKLYFGVQKENEKIVKMTLSKNLGWPFVGRTITPERSHYLPEEIKSIYDEIMKIFKGDDHEENQHPYQASRTGR